LCVCVCEREGVICDVEDSCMCVCVCGHMTRVVVRECIIIIIIFVFFTTPSE
jgi:hypothetical protein